MSLKFMRGWPAVIGIAFIGIVIRALLLQSPVHADELDCMMLYPVRGWWFTVSAYSAANNHIAYNLLLQGLAWIFGSELWAVRLPAFVCGCLLIPATAWAMNVLAGGRAGLYAAMLVATCPLFINYSIYARGYSLLLLLLIVSVIQLNSLLQQPHWKLAVALGITWSLAAWTIPIAVHAVSCLMLWGLIERSRMRPDRRSAVMQQLAIATAVTAGCTLALYSPVLVVSGWRALLADPATQPQAWSALPSQAAEQLSDTAWIVARDLGPAGWILPLCLAAIGVWCARHRQRRVANLALCALGMQVAWMVAQRVLPFPRAMLPLWWTLGLAAGVGIACIESFVRRSGVPMGRSAFSILAFAGTLGIAVAILNSRQTLGINGYWPHDFQQISSILAGKPPQRLFANYADAGLTYYLTQAKIRFTIDRYSGPGEYFFICRKGTDGLDNVTRKPPGLDPLIEIWHERGGASIAPAHFQRVGETRYYQLYILRSPHP